MPPVKSRYSLPSESHTRRPSPRTSATGCRLVKVMSRASESSIIRLVSTWRLLLEDDLRPDALALHQALGLPLDERRDVLAVIAHDPLHVGQMDELLGQERGGHVPRDEVGVDVVRRAPRADSHGGDDG